VSSGRRLEILPRLGIAPAVRELVRARLDEAFAAAEADAVAGTSRPRGSGGAPGVAVLDAACGRATALVAYRHRIGHLVGADLHRPASGALRRLDTFVAVDLCRDREAFASAAFDIVHCGFAVEHLADPAAAFHNIRAWLRPGGTLVLVTVNRRHPLVAAYLGLPAGPRARLQRRVKARAADAHPLVGACNDPGVLRRSLEAAGFEDVRMTSAGHLARAWSRWLPSYLLGLAGDLLAQPFPSRRSTLVVSARVPREGRRAAT